MDPEKLREMALADGGKSQKYKGVELLLATDDAASDTQMAIIGDSLVLLGDKAALSASIDRSFTVRNGEPNPAREYDLWIRGRAPAPGIQWHDFGLAFSSGGVKVDSHMRAASTEVAQSIASNARVQEMIATQTGADVHIMANISRDEFMRKAGQWRTSLEELAQAAPPAPPGKQTIRIYGLDDGTREVPLGSPK
jgi:hypothetical protein